ncbi:MAG: hypothetical protein ACLQDL_06155, partial [Spirochaetia bacterium]
MRDCARLFETLVARLERRARWDDIVRGTAAGLFFGLLPGFVVALLAGSVSLPVAAPLFAAVLGAAGCVAGICAALLRRADRRELLVDADRILESRELTSTALELIGSTAPGIFAEAVIEDAVQLLARTSPRTILGRLIVPLAPFAALAAFLTASGLLFPVDLAALFPRRAVTSSVIAQIGEDLRMRGERLAEDARARSLARSLELGQQLAQLGNELAARKAPREDSVDRMSRLEAGLTEEYELRMKEVRTPGRSPLGDALDSLRQAQRQLQGEAGGGAAPPRSPALPRRQSSPTESAPGSRDLPPGQGDNRGSGPQARNPGATPGGAGEGGGAPRQGAGEGGSGIGTTPAPVKRAAPTTIVEGGSGPALQVQGNAPEGGSTRLLARALPEWTGARVPEKAILNRYSR